jgi:hypothetical protein
LERLRIAAASAEAVVGVLTDAKIVFRPSRSCPLDVRCERADIASVMPSLEGGGVVNNT